MTSFQKLFKKYFASFIVVFIVPVTIIMVCIFILGKNFVSKQLYKKDKIVTELATNRLNSELDYCFNIANSLSKQESSQSFNLQKHPSKGMSLISTLFNYTSLNNTLANIAVHYYDQDYFYFNNTSMSDSYFYSHYFAECYNPYELKTLLTNLSEPYFLGTVTHENHKYYTLSIPLTFYYNQQGVVLFFLDAEKVHTNLLGTDSQSREFYLVNTLDLPHSLFNTPLTENLRTLDPNSFYREISLLGEQGTIFKDLDNHLLYAQKNHAKIDNLLLVSTISRSEVFKPLTSFMVTVLICLLVTLLLASVCIYYMAKYHFAPIKSLNSSLTQLSEDNSVLKDEIHKTLPMKQYFLLNQLLNGNVIQISAFIKECELNHIFLDSPYHTILVIKSYLYDFTLDQTILDTLQHMQNTEILHHYMIQQTYTYGDIYLLGIQQPLKFNTLNLPQGSFYFGRTSKRLSQIPKSYIDARTQSELGSTILKTPPTLQTSFNDHKVALLQLNAYLQVGEFNKIPEYILKLIQSIQNEQIPFPLQKSILIEIILLFNHYIDKQDPPLQYDKLDLVALFKEESFDALKEIVVEVTTEMLALICSHQQVLKPPLSMVLIKAFIKKHYTESSFIPEYIAVHFNMPLAQLETYFYEANQSSLTQYITEQRIEQAKILLTQTPYSLKVISDEVGFTHISSFMSAFKQLCDCTPGQYRSHFTQPPNTSA